MEGGKGPRTHCRRHVLARALALRVRVRLALGGVLSACRPLWHGAPVGRQASPMGQENGGRLRPQNRLRAGSFPWLQTAFWYKGGKEPLPGTQERTME